MKRNEWTFDYPVSDLAAASAKKRAHHEARLDRMAAAKQEVSRG